MFSNNLTMMTDLYELTMMQGYFFEGNEDKVVFDVFYRKNPSGSAYAITCGLDQVIDYIKNLSFSYEDIYYLRGLGILKKIFFPILLVSISAEIFMQSQREVSYFQRSHL